MNLVLTFDISLKANSNASTHTNYLNFIVKERVEKEVRPLFRPDP
jgi:hypothetical protein